MYAGGAGGIVTRADEVARVDDGFFFDAFTFTPGIGAGLAAECAIAAFSVNIT
jgi:orotidine-5'-phosphate decarboxylase